jgi:hypothetical protein
MPEHTALLLQCAQAMQQLLARHRLVTRKKNDPEKDDK